MNIGEAAALSGLPAKTIRYYEEAGLVTPAARGDNGYRRYSEQDVHRLRFLQRARSLGFSVANVASLLALWRDKHRASAQVKALASRHVEEIDLKIAELRAMRDALDDLVLRCHGDDRPDCPILTNLASATR